MVLRSYCMEAEEALKGRVLDSMNSDLSHLDLEYFDWNSVENSTLARLHDADQEHCLRCCLG